MRDMTSERSFADFFRALRDLIDRIKRVAIADVIVAFKESEKDRGQLLPSTDDMLMEFVSEIRKEMKKWAGEHGVPKLVVDMSLKAPHMELAHINYELAPNELCVAIFPENFHFHVFYKVSETRWAVAIDCVDAIITTLPRSKTEIRRKDAQKGGGE